MSVIINGCKNIERELFKQLNGWQSNSSLDKEHNVSKFTETAMKLVVDDNSSYQQIRRYIMEVFTLDIKDIHPEVDDYEITNN